MKADITEEDTIQASETLRTNFQQHASFLGQLEEARNAEKMKIYNKLSYVYIPDVYWDFTTTRVLTMEYVDGVPLYDQNRLIDADFDRKQLAQRLATAIFSQILENGFFMPTPIRVM